MAYLIDTDIFIAGKNLHYGMDFCPAFWEWLVVANEAGKLIGVEAVHDDLVEGGDDLAEWAKARDDGFFVFLQSRATFPPWAKSRSGLTITRSTHPRPSKLFSIALITL